MKQFIVAWLACIAFLLPSPHARAEDAGDAVLGVWKTAENKGTVTIFKRDGHYFGQILTLTDPKRPKQDINNPDPQLRDRPIVGIEFMRDFVYVGRNRWEDGKVYDPESGKTYKCKMILKKPNELEVRGFIGFSLFGRTTVWTR